MKIIVAGGTGFVGRALVERLRENGHEAVVLSRRDKSVSGVSLDGADAVVNLAGESISKRWSKDQKKKIIEMQGEHSVN